MVATVVSAEATREAPVRAAVTPIPTTPPSCIGTYAGQQVSVEGMAVDAVPLTVSRVSVDGYGTPYLSLSMPYNLVATVARDNTLTGVAGIAATPYIVPFLPTSPDVTPATSAALQQPTGMAVRLLESYTQGDVYIADTAQSVVYRVEAATGYRTVVAGTGKPNSPVGNGGPASAARLSSPTGIAFDRAGTTLYIGEVTGYGVRAVDLATGIIRQAAGNGHAGYAGDSGPATAAQLTACTDVTTDQAGNLFIADTGNGVVRRVIAATGIITTVAGNASCPIGVPNYNGDGIAATAACLATPSGVDINLVAGSYGSLVIADKGNARVRAVALASGIISTLAGNGTVASWSADGVATATAISPPLSVAVTLDGVVYFSERVRVRRIVNGWLQTVAGMAPSLHNPVASAAFLNSVTALRVNTTNNDVFVADSQSGYVMLVSGASRAVQPVVGNGGFDFNGDGAPATQTAVGAVVALCLTAAGDLLMAASSQWRVRILYAANGTVGTFAGSNGPGNTGDGGPATAATLTSPRGLVQMADGRVLITDVAAYVVRVVYTNGFIDRFAGSGQPQPYNGDGLPASAVNFGGPTGVAADANGNVYIADTVYARVRVVLVNGTVITYAGTGRPGWNGDGLPATATNMGVPTGLRFDAFGNLYVTQGGSEARVLVVAGDSRLVSVYAGTGQAGYTGDGGPPTAAEVSSVTDMDFDSYGNGYLADSWTCVVRLVVTVPVVPCPVGHACPCGMPAPCKSPIGYCPGNTIMPLPTGRGYYAVPSPPKGHYTSQTACPLGAYCAGGVKTLCPPGTISAAVSQTTEDCCQPCPAGTYTEAPGTTVGFFCHACPMGTYNPEPGAHACAACPPNTFNPVHGARGNESVACHPCPPGWQALPGAASCSPASGTLLLDRFVTSLYHVPAPVTSGTTPLAAYLGVEVAVALPIILLSLVPGALLLTARRCPERACCHSRLKAGLRAIDLFAMRHNLGEGDSPVYHRTTLGGGLSSIAVGTVVALAAVLLVQYREGSTLVQQSTLPATPQALTAVAAMPPALVGNPHPLLPPLTTGVTVLLQTQGAVCNAPLTVTPFSLMGGEFMASTSEDPIAKFTNITLQCAECAFGPMSRLFITLNGACQAVRVTVGSVSVSNTLSVATTLLTLESRNSSEASRWIQSATIPMLPRIAVIQDTITNEAQRGIIVQPQPADVKTGPDLPDVVTIEILFATDADYVHVQVMPLVSATQLLSSIIGLSGLLGGFATLFGLVERWGRPAVDKWLPRRFIRVRAAVAGYNGSGPRRLPRGSMYDDTAADAPPPGSSSSINSSHAEPLLADDSASDGDAASAAAAKL